MKYIKSLIVIFSLLFPTMIYSGQETKPLIILPEIEVVAKSPIKEIHGFIQNLNSTVDESESYVWAATLYKSCKQYNFNPIDITAQLYKESSFSKDVIVGKRKSSAGATGIAQFMPATARRLKVNPTDAVASIKAMVKEMDRIRAKNIEEGYGPNMAYAQQRYNAGGPRFKQMYRKGFVKETRLYPVQIAKIINRYEKGQEDHRG